MKKAILDPRQCKSCQPCTAVLACTFRAFIKESENEVPFIDMYKCSGCGKCIRNCSNGAISLLIQPCGKAKQGW